MAKYNLEILGDNSKFNATVNQSMEKLDELSANAGGFFDGISGGASKATGALNALTGMNPALAALGVAGAAAGVALKMMFDVIERVDELNKISTASGVSVENLQKLQQAFRTTGLDIEKFGDINRDTMDKIGDSTRNWKGGVLDDVKEFGLQSSLLSKYAGDSEQGIKTVIAAFYQMKQAGRSDAEITNMMETFASDSSKLIPVLKESKDETEALKKIQGEHATVTQETADATKQFQDNMNTLSQNMDDLKLKVLSPLIGEMNDLWSLFNRDWSGADLIKALQIFDNNHVKKFFFTGDGGIWEKIRSIAGVGEKAEDGEYYSKEKQDNVDYLKNKLAADKKAVEENNKKKATMAAAYADSEKKRIAAETKAKEEADEKAKKAADAKAKSAASAAKAAADKAKAEHDKMISERKAAFDKLSAMSGMLFTNEASTIASSSNQVRAAMATLYEARNKNYIDEEQYVSKRKSLIAKSQNDFALLLIGADSSSLPGLLNAVDEVYNAQLTDLQAKRAKNLIDQADYNTQLENLEAEHQAKMDAFKSLNTGVVNANMATDMGGATEEDQATIEQDALDKKAIQWANAQKSMYEKGIIDHDQFLANKERLDRMYSQRTQEISQKETVARLGMYSSFAGNMGTIISGLAGKQSSAARAAFAVSKGLAVAQGMINAYQSATKALADYPGPVGYAMAASSYASVLANVMSMNSVQGQFHDGIDNVPNTGTYLLEGGERVVDKRLNNDLKDYLGRAEENNNGQPQSIDASISNIKTTVDERQLMTILRKQQATVTAIVQDGQRRAM